jgi:hypothetical protein
MANDVLIAIGQLNDSITKGIGGLGDTAIEGAKLKMQGAELGMRLDKDRREKELFPILKATAQAESEQKIIMANRLKQEEEHLDQPFDLETFLDAFKQGKMTASKAMWMTNLMEKMPKVFGTNVELKTDPDTGKPLLYDMAKGKSITNREFFRKDNQAGLGGLISMNADPIKWLEDKVAEGDPDAIAEYKKAQKDPLTFYQGVAKQKETMLNQMTRAGLVDKETLHLYEEGLKDSREMVKKLTMSPEDRAKYEATMRYYDTMEKIHGLDIKERQIRLAPLEMFGKLTGPDQQLMKGLEHQADALATKFAELDAKMDKNDPQTVASRNQVIRDLGLVRDEQKKIWSKYGDLNPAKSEIGGQSTTAQGMDTKKILEGSKGVPFVDRILNPDKYPKLQEGDSDASLKLSSSKTDQGVLVFPTVIHNKESNELVDLSKDPGRALQVAIRRGDALQFPNEKSANEFIKGYKQGGTLGEPTQGAKSSQPKEAAIGGEFTKRSGKGGGIKQDATRLYSLVTRGGKGGPLSTQQVHDLAQSFVETHGENARPIAKRVLAKAAIDNNPELQGKYIEQIAVNFVKNGWSVERAREEAKKISSELNPAKDLQENIENFKRVYKELGTTEAVKLAFDVWGFVDATGYNMIEGTAEMVMGRIGERSSKEINIDDAIGGF